MPTPQILHQPIASAALKRGFDKLAHLLALTLGPTQGHIINRGEMNGKPELLADAATIARRVLQLPDRAEDVGAMLLRHLVWRMNQRVGDGSALAAVLAQAILDHAHRVVTAGGNPMLVKSGIERAARAASDALMAQAQPIRDAQDLAIVAFVLTGDPNLSNLLGEMFWTLGPDAYVTIEEYVAPYLAGEYVQGGRWAGRLASPYFITDQARQRAELEACPVALVASTVATLEDVRPFLEQVNQTEAKTGVLIAEGIQGTALTTLAANFQRGDIKVVGIELRSLGEKRRHDFEDLAVLTGAAALIPEYGQSPQRLTARDLGTLRRIEASADEVMIVGDGQQFQAVEQQVARLKARLDRLPAHDEGRDELRQRMARLNAQTAVLKVGGYTESERDVVKQRAEKALRALPLALREGVVAGGGVAYLNCIEAARSIPAEDDEVWGANILAQALQAPFLRLVENANVDAPHAVLAEVRRLGPEYGYDVENEEIVSMLEADVLDPVGVLRQALEMAVSGAMMALTVETIVLHKTPTTIYEP